MRVVDVLKAARAKIAKQANWTQRAYARNSSSVPISTLSDGAMCWCAEGSVMSMGQSSAVNHAAISAISQASGSACVANFNDSHTHAEVLAAFDRAIAAEESK